MRYGNVSTQRLVESKIIIQQTVPEHKFSAHDCKILTELVNAQFYFQITGLFYTNQVSNQMGQ